MQPRRLRFVLFGWACLWFVACDSSRSRSLDETAKAASSSLRAGTLNGEMSVGADGEARYDLPLWLPPGRAGIQPPLSLSYSSRRGNGLLGVGWTLGGFSEIVRCRKTLGEDGAHRAVRFDAEDALCLDGMRLVPDGNGRYRTRPDTFSRIEPTVEVDAIGAPVGWTVYEKSGLIKRYGVTVDATIRARHGDGVSRAYGWLLRTVEDRRGNSYTITYERNPAAEYVAWNRPLEISYTGQRGSGGSQRVWFEYDDTFTDDSVRHVGGLALGTRGKLKTIRTSVTGTDSRSYSLEHERSPRSGRARLAAVQACAPNGACLPKTSFTYSSAGPATWQPFTGDIGEGDAAVSVVSVRNQGALHFADFNDDARDDMLYWADGAWHLRLGTGSGFAPPSPHVLRGGAAYPGDTPTPIQIYDADGDGRPDVFKPYCTQEPEIFCGVGRFRWADVGWSGDLYRGWDDEELMDVRLLDRIPSFINDNGGAQATFTFINDANRLELVYDLRSSFRFEPTGHPSYPWVHPSNPEESLFRDLDGDGETELLIANGSAFTLLRAKVEGRPGQLSTIEVIDNGAAGLEPDRCNIFADTNGDGLLDVVNPVARTYFKFDGLRFRNTADYRTPQNPPLRCRTGDDPGVRVVDYDGDGTHDLLIVEKQHPGPEPMRVSIRGQFEQEVPGLQLLTPDAFEEHEPPPGSPPIVINLDHGELVRTVDVNGDGQFDVFQMTGDNTFHLSIQTSPPVDVLVSVSDGLAAVSSVAYASFEELAAVGRYSQCKRSECSLCGCSESGWMGPMTVVASQSLPERSGENMDILYSYGAVQSDPYAGFGGFTWRAAFDQGTGTTVRTDFEQAYYNSTDVPEGQEFARLGRLKQRVTYTPLGQGKWFASSEKPTYEVVETVDGTYAVYTKVSESKVYEGTEFDPSDPSRVFNRTDVEFTSSVRVVSTFDSYGTARTIEIDRGGDHKTRIDRPDIEDREGSWLLGLVRKETVTSSTPNSGEATRRVETEYDDWGQVQDVYRQKGEDGAQHVHYERDARGLVERVSVIARNAVGQDETRVSTTQYDSDGIYPVRTTNSLGHDVVVAWEPLIGAIDSITDVPNGLTTSFDYDEFGRTTSVRNPDGTSVTTTYSQSPGPVSLLVSNTPTNGPQTVVSYDRAGRFVEGKQFIGSPRCEPSSSGIECASVSRIYEQVTYDAVGRIDRVVGPLFLDLLGGSSPPAYELEYEYDPLGRVLKITAADGSASEYRYEPRAMETRNEDCASPSAAAPCERRRTEIDAQGRVTRTLRYPDGVNGIETEYEYGPFDVLETVFNHDRKNEMRQVHDALGRRTKLEDPDVGVVVTAWDGFDEVASVTRGVAPNAIVESYAYDALGRVVRRSAPDGADEFEYDNAPGKGVGKIAATRRGDVVESYGYDNVGRLAQVTQVVDGESFVTDLGYDELGSEENTPLRSRQLTAIPSGSRWSDAIASSMS